jgi:hypothetical protein
LASSRQPRRLREFYGSINPHVRRVRYAIHFWLEQSLVPAGPALPACRNPSTYLCDRQWVGESICICRRKPAQGEDFGQRTLLAL